MGGSQVLVLGSACSKIGSGATPRGGKEAYRGGATSLIRSQNIYNEGFEHPGLVRIDDKQAAELGNVDVQVGDVLLNITGDSVARCCQVDPTVLPARVNQHVAIIRTLPEILDARFLRYVLVSPALQARLMSLASAGATRSALTKGMLEALTITVPPVDEQRAIAHVLGTLDDKIALSRRTNRTLESLGRTLFKSWFVDFDPVRAKAEGRQPVGMGAETAKLFPHEFEEAQLGPIPKGWARSPLGAWVSAQSGGTPSKSHPSFWGGDIPWISPKVMTSIHADEADDFVTPSAVGNGTRIAPRGSTLVMVRGMGLHQEVRVSQARWDVTFNQDVKALVPKAIEPSLLLFALLDGQQELLGRVESSGHGTGKLPSEILLGHPIAMPPPGIQKQLAAFFDALNDRIGAVRAESRTLTKLRDGLLPRLLSGQLVIPETTGVAGARA